MGFLFSWLRGLLRRNRFSARSPTPCCASCRLRRGDRVALLRRPSSLFPRAARFSGRSATKKGCLSSPCMVARATSAQPFLRTLPHTLLRLVPPSAGRPRCVAPPSQLSVSTRSAFFRQVRHEKSTAKAVPYRGGPARARTAVLQSSSADTTRLVCDQISPAGSPQTTCSLGTLP